MAPKYINAIMNPDDKSFDRLSCPSPTSGRYDNLKHDIRNPAKKKYFFALDLHDCVNLLPRLIGSIVETMLFLGPKNCALSVIEGRSTDGTFEVLQSLRTEIEGIGAAYYFDHNDINTQAEGADRIKLLAELRNSALDPLRKNSAQYTVNSTVIFLNDIALCMEDILELIHQRVHQEADMVCGMDWIFVGPDPTFYDVWIARDMKGDSFFNIPADGNWNSAWNLFWNNEETQSLYRAHKPFQVFSCWNGITAFTATPIIADRVKFRSSSEGECHQGEPKLFAKDMWHEGYGKIAVIPSVNVEYSDQRAKDIKNLKGYVSGMTNGDQSDLIEWNPNPPELVKCMRTSQDQPFLPWNETLT